MSPTNYIFVAMLSPTTTNLSPLPSPIVSPILLFCQRKLTYLSPNKFIIHCLLKSYIGLNKSYTKI